jgi:hypothetical protein
MSSKVTDPRWIAGTLRRHSRLLVATGLLGLAASSGYVMVQPPPLTSTTLVLLPTPALADSSSSDVETQIRIARSAPIRKQAGQAVVPALPARSVEKMVEVSAPTDQIIQIDATSTNAAQAQMLSQALADSYVGYVSRTAREVTAAALASLNVRRDALNAQITKLQAEITAAKKRQRAVDPDSPDATEEAQLLARLGAEQANLSLQLDKVEDKIATGTPGSSVGAGTSVVQPAAAATGPSIVVRLLVWAPASAFVCTIITVAVLLTAARRDPRVRLRDEIADAVGSPVLAAVRSMPQSSVAGWSTLLETYEATATESWAFRRLLRSLAPGDHRPEPGVAGKVDHPKSLTVVSLSGDARGIAIGPQLAAFASSLGVVTQIFTAAGQRSAPSLWAACATEREVGARPGLYIGDVSDREAIDLTIVLVTVDRRQPTLGDTPASAATILSVAAGTATAQELARVAVAVDDTGRRVDGIVVADPDQGDHTSGRHTMEERSRQLPLPVRLTGIPSSGGAKGHQYGSRP